MKPKKSWKKTNQSMYFKTKIVFCYLQSLKTKQVYRSLTKEGVRSNKNFTIVLTDIELKAI